ncbi:hypothetical protein LEP1GSC039_0060 [Leptospira santarosai str. 2000027870]|nr:hypothetical protein LEP1GSC039_0060 [Leptospira santarosai str. 2000027870]
MDFISTELSGNYRNTLYGISNNRSGVPTFRFYGKMNARKKAPNARLFKFDSFGLAIV